MTRSLRYVGRDLEATCFALNYHRWVFDIFKPYLGTRVVEVGAGTGSFSGLLIDHRVESLSLIEPSDSMYELLMVRLTQLRPVIPIQTFNDLFTEIAAQIKAEQHPDSIIYVNVLEHIADDTTELSTVYQTLDSGGRVFIFVPALQWLYGSFDRQIGHFRRYQKSELENKCRHAGFEVIRSSYFDAIGIIPWWVKYRLFRSGAMEPGAVKFYDQRVVPLIRKVEHLIEPPIGKNIILIAERV